MRIRTKFLIVFFAISFLPLVFLTYVNFNSAKQVLVNDTKEKLETIAALQISRIREGDMQPPSLSVISADYTSLGSTGEILIARRGENGEIAYINPRRFEELAKNPSFLMNEALNKKEGFFTDVIDYRGKSVAAVVRYLPDLDLGVVVKIDTDEAFKSVYSLRDIILIFSFIFILVIVMVTLFFVHSITAPVLNLVSVAKQVSKGDLSKRALILSKDEIGELSMSFNSMVDSLQDSHQDLEKKVHERTQQLESANKDLESFTYSVSHDLRAPLRAIDGFSQILEEDYAAKLDDEGKSTIATIRRSTQQMGNLIDDLLAFSRLGRQEIKTEKIEMTTFAKTVFDEIKSANPGRRITFTCQELPAVYVDASLMRQVWINLLSNAVKFTKKKDIAVISVGSTTEKDMITYHITDNGAGFDMKYVDKLFGVFQRLHNVKDFEGTGVGLAIVSRIIAKHGGKTWAEGEVDKGATFYFSLPKKDVAIL